MSERGSFVTEYVYCPECLEKMKKVLLQDHKYLKGVQIEGYHFEDGRKSDPLPIIAGKIGGLGAREELYIFQFQTFEEDNAPCHPVRVAVLSDHGDSEIFVVKPNGLVETLDEWRAGNE